MTEYIKNASKKFEELLERQLKRVEMINASKEYIDYSKLDKIIIGVAGGDGIGPVITNESARVLKYLLSDEVKAGRVEFKDIEGLTIENRVKHNKAIPDDVLDEIKK